MNTRKSTAFEDDQQANSRRCWEVSFGQRIAKHVHNAQTDMLEKSTYYILDAQGNQMSMYEHVVDTSEVKYYLAERNIYGSSRLGTTHDFVNMYNPEPLPSYGNTGNRKYELNNHLGNVLMVITDQVYPLDENNDEETDGYEVGISNTFDYSPFGVQLDGRTMERMVQVCTEVTETVTAYALNETFDAGGSWSGSVAYVSGKMNIFSSTKGQSPISASKTFTMDEGDYIVTFDIVSNSCTATTSATSPPSIVTVSVYDALYNLVASGSYQTASGSYSFSLNALSSGNYTIIVSTANAGACTLIMDNIVISREEISTNFICETRPASYRYGFNGMEKDDEVKTHGGTSYDFGARMYDSRLGRWLSIDPLASKYPGQSPYVFCNNNPLLYKDPNGESGIITITPGENGNPGTIKISMNLRLYGDGADPVLAEITANKLNKMVNDAKLKYLINGEEYIVQLDLTVMYETEFASYTNAQGYFVTSPKNSNYADNFVRVEEINQAQKAKGDANGWVALKYAHKQGKVSEWGAYGGNSGFLIKDDLKNDPTSVLHELFHGLFSTHTAIENMKPDLPALSIPANSPASDFENMPGTYLTTNNKGVEVVDEKKRMLTIYDLNIVFQALGYETEGNCIDIKLNKTGSTIINVGKLNNNYYDKSGNVDNDRNSRRSNN